MPQIPTPGPLTGKPWEPPPGPLNLDEATVRSALRKAEAAGMITVDWSNPDKPIVKAKTDPKTWFGK